MQQNLPDIFLNNHINPFQFRFIQLRTSGSINSQNLHLTVRKQNVLHLNQNLPHDILLHRIIKHIKIRLKSLLIRDILQNNRLTVLRTHRIKIQVSNCRHLLINLSQQILIHLRKSCTADKFKNIPARTNLIPMQLNH